MPQIARIGDPISHGGQIIEGSGDVRANSIGVARLGDKALCLEHGMVQIASASGTVTANGRGVARVGDVTSCGAVIIQGSPNVSAG